MSDTKHKILDTAERLIAEQGYAAISLRHIIAEAGVNLASIHYHFGSKEGLFDELIGDRVASVNNKRVELLNQAIAVAAPGSPSVESLVRAFMRPTGEAAARNPLFVKVMGRVVAEGLLPSIVERHFRPSARPFIEALRRALPGLSDEEFQWRIHFMTGSIAHTMCQSAAAAAVDFPTRMDYLIQFVTAGLCAPAGRSMEVKA